MIQSNVATHWFHMKCHQIMWIMAVHKQHNESSWLTITGHKWTGIQCIINNRKMPQNHKGEETKHQIIKACAAGEDLVEVAWLLNMKRTSAWSIINHYQQYGQVQCYYGGAHNNKVDQMIDYCVEIIKEHSEYILPQINAELHLQLPAKPRVCDSTVSKMLHVQLVRLKVLETVPIDQNTDEFANGWWWSTELVMRSSTLMKVDLTIAYQGFVISLELVTGCASHGCKEKTKLYHKSDLQTAIGGSTSSTIATVIFLQPSWIDRRNVGCGTERPQPTLYSVFNKKIFF